jgi:hypothetical protein
MIASLNPPTFQSSGLQSAFGGGYSQARYALPLLSVFSGINELYESILKLTAFCNSLYLVRFDFVRRSFWR